MSLTKELVDDGSGKVKAKTPLPLKKIGIIMAIAMVFLFLFSPSEPEDHVEAAQHHQGRIPGANETYLRVGNGVEVQADKTKATPGDSQENPKPEADDSSPVGAPESDASPEEQSTESKESDDDGVIEDQVDDDGVIEDQVDDDENGGGQADDDENGGGQADDNENGGGLADDDENGGNEDLSPENVPAGEEEHSNTGPAVEEDSSSVLEKIKKLSADALHLTVKQVPISSDFASPEKLNENLRAAKNRMLQQLNVEYGETHARKIFFTPEGDSRGKLGFFEKEKQETWDRFKRKMKMKLFRVMVDAQQGKQESDVEFIWATGGHSASAGHGNLFHDSYTAIMERTARNVFASVGIRLIGKNYAMGGTASAPEIASCAKEIFGEDIDVISWDYGMTDGIDCNRMLLYFYRAGLIKSRPAMVVVHGGGRSESHRRAAMNELNSRNIVTFFSNETVLEELRAGVPDTLGMTDEQIEQLPEMVRNFKCGDIYLETGDPYCGAQKFSDALCFDRKGKTSWHPGWKMHALEGNLLAFFLVDALSEALEDIVSSSSDPQATLSEIKQKEVDDYNVFKSSSVSNALRQIFSSEVTEEIDINAIALGPNFCHTARLPAEIRYKGILTESTNVGIQSYDKGISSFAVQNPNDSEFMRLVHDDSERVPCDVPIVMDHKDYFYVGHEEGAKIMRIPNDLEVQEYGKLENPKGYVAWCTVMCPWGKCPNGELQADAITTGEVEIEVNGQRVVGFKSSYECHFLQNELGYTWEPNEDGRYEVQFRPTAPNSFIRVSSLVVW